MKKRPGKVQRGASICLRGANNEILYNGALNALSIPEPVVLSLSQHFFNDPNPCFIHRGAVISRVLAEIEEALPDGKPMPCHALPARVSAYFGVYGAASVTLYAGAS